MNERGAYPELPIVEAEHETSSLIERDLGWTVEEAAEIRARLSSFSRLWDAPGMEDYDEL